MLPLAPTYQTTLAVQMCTLQHFLEDIAQGQVAYAFVIFCMHQIGPQEWRKRSFLWFGICVGIQWLCSYLLPLPQILMSNVFICFAFFPNQFFVIYSVAFLLALPVFLHLMICIIMSIFRTSETTNNQIYPPEQIDSIEIDYQLSMRCILIMALLFDIIGYGPRSILAVIDYQLQESIAIYAALEILPSLCLLIDLGLLYKMNKEVRKKFTSVCGC
ncbi:unnamed protein product [Rotaria sp. Silwood2]|nr:unnamed protein product [Rotaria sp. Silwood2]CAF2661889.1 unnamed protein product [Rotaria sp. Silwood2]CAF2867573.1 unnamed protein product [Rotaria sp. Silwood2]CAF3270282.1 unnamed protein product [Rotaria sp. Silwood2]CAF4086084.1 unnamed protein product [Rotaria sp. Silwood2]